MMCSVPCNRRVADSNLPQAIAQRPLKSCSTTIIIICEEGNGRPPHSSHPSVAYKPMDLPSGREFIVMGVAAAVTVYVLINSINNCQADASPMQSGVNSDGWLAFAVRPSVHLCVHRPCFCPSVRPSVGASVRRSLGASVRGCVHPSACRYI